MHCLSPSVNMERESWHFWNTEKQDEGNICVKLVWNAPAKWNFYSWGRNLGSAPAGGTHVCTDYDLLEGCSIIPGRAWASSKMHLKCPHRHAWDIRPTELLWFHHHGLSFIVKPWASKGIPAMYEQSCQALIWSKPRHRKFSVTCSLPCRSHTQSSDS